MTATIVSSRSVNSSSTSLNSINYNNYNNNMTSVTIPITTIDSKKLNLNSTNRPVTSPIRITSYSIITRTETTTQPTEMVSTSSLKSTPLSSTSSSSIPLSSSSSTQLAYHQFTLSPSSIHQSSLSSLKSLSSSVSATAAELPPTSPKNDKSSIFQQKLSSSSVHQHQLSSLPTTTTTINSTSSSSSSTSSSTTVTTIRPTTAPAPRQVTTIPVQASRTTATIITSNKRPTIIIYPTVSPESIVIPIVSCILGFPILALMVICCLRRRAKLARERDRRRNYDMQDHAVSLVRFSPIHRLNNRSSRAISLRPERSLSRGFPSLELDTVIEERSDPEQTQTDIISPESPLDSHKFRDFNSS